MDNPFADLIPAAPQAAPQAVQQAAPVAANPFADLIPTKPIEGVADVAPARPMEPTEAFLGGAVRGVPIIGPALDKAASAGSAALGAIVNGVPFSEGMDRSQARAADVAQANPGTDLAGQVAGNVAAMAPLGATAIGARALGIEGGNLATRMSLGGLTGGGIAGADALARGEDPIQAVKEGGALGAAVPLVGGALSRAVSPFRAASPAREAAVNTLRNEGVDITAGQATGSRRLQFLEAEMGGPRAADMVARQGDQFTGAVLRRAGIDATRATPDVVDSAFTRIGNQFDNLAARNSLTIDRPLVRDLLRSVREYENLVPPSQRAPVVDNMVRDIGNAANANGGVISGETYQAARSRLDKMARTSARDPQLQDALFGIRNALDNAMERNISPRDRTAWQDARRQYRNMLVIEKAATGAGADTAEGLISPAALRNAVVNQGRRGYARGRGDFADLARAGVNVMSRLPDSGTAGRLKAQGVSNIVGAGVGAAVGGGNGDQLGIGNTAGGVIGAAAGLMAPGLIGRAALSRPGQAFLRNQAASPQAMTRALTAVEQPARRRLFDDLIGR